MNIFKIFMLLFMFIHSLIEATNVNALYISPDSIPCEFESDSEFDYKPEVDVYLYEPLLEPRFVDGILYWHLSNPSLLATSGEKSKLRKWNGKTHKFSTHRTNMLEELPAFLSRQKILPKLYVFTGVTTREDVDHFIHALRASSYDTFTEEGDIWKFEHRYKWHTYWNEAGQILIVSRHGFIGKNLTEAVTIDSSYFGQPLHIGNMLAIRVKLDLTRYANVLVYYSNAFNLDVIKKRGIDPGSVTITGHPSVIGLELALNRARSFFNDTENPLIVTSNLNLPIIPGENGTLSDHLRDTLKVPVKLTLHSSPGNFDSEQNILSRFTLNHKGSIDFSNPEHSSELVDLVSLDRMHEGFAQYKMTMKVIKFHSTTWFPFPVMNDDIRTANQILEETTIQTNLTETNTLNQQMVDYSLRTPSGHFPIYAEMQIPEHQPIKPDEFCNHSSYPVVDIPAITGTKVHKFGPTNSINLSLNYPGAEILRFARELLPADSTVHIMMDQKQKVYAIPVRHAKKQCRAIEKNINHAAFGALEKGTDGTLKLSSVQWGTGSRNLWIHITGRDPNEYANDIYPPRKFDHKYVEKHQGRTYRYFVFRGFKPDLVQDTSPKH